MEPSIHEWHFDVHQSRKANYIEVDVSRQKLTVCIDGKERLILKQCSKWLCLSMWGNPVMGVEEPGTRSFLDALILGLTKLRDVVDCPDTLPPMEYKTS